MKKYNQYSQMVFMWLFIAMQYSSRKCKSPMNIYIYMTPFKKELPDSRIHILDSNNVNSAFTYTTCKPDNEILIFRKEEWFKVFIHETFHNLGLDFSNMNLYSLNNKIKCLFAVNSDINAYESYCEFWARIINSAFISFYLLEDNEIGKNKSPSW